MWEANAKYVEETYGAHVDWEERFYECPECGEPVYECDWDVNMLTWFLCPICEFKDEENDEPDNIDADCGYDPYMGCYTDDC